VLFILEGTKKFGFVMIGVFRFFAFLLCI